MRKKAAKKDNAERWLLSYADFMTLLLAFFIIMYASSTISQSKLLIISESFKAAFGGGQTIIGNSSAVDIQKTAQYVQNKNSDPTKMNQSKSKNNSDATTQTQQEQNKLQQLQQQLNAYINANGMSKSVSTEIQDRGLVVSIQDALFFDSGKADIKPIWIKNLVEMSTMIKAIDNYIRIEGYTDNVPITTSQYQDNLALSCARAANVYRLFEQQGHINPARLSAEGYGDTRPIADNNTDVGRSRNRRVDIVVLDSKYQGAEVGK